MKTEGIDTANIISSSSARALRTLGKRFVCRYLAPPGSSYDWKRLRNSEVVALRKAGIALVCVFESSAGRARSGYDAGVQDARWARDSLTSLGIPRAPVYFAVDFDATPGDQREINAYLRGAASVLSKSKVGIYGGYYPVKRALDAGVVKYAWQTYAWSGGQRDPRGQLYQYNNGQRVAGLSVDLDRSYAADYGQVGFKLPAHPPHPVPIPTPNKPKRKPAAPLLVEFVEKDGSHHFEQTTRRGLLFRATQFVGGKFRELHVTRQ